MPHRVAFLGFTESERHALNSYFRLAHNRSPSYEHVATLTDADLLVADADHAPSVQLVVATERLPETVFIGAQGPQGSAASMRRPIDALQVLRELDGIVARQAPRRPARDDGGQRTTIIQAMRRQREAEPAPVLPLAPSVFLSDLPDLPLAASKLAGAGSVPRPAPLLDPDLLDEPPSPFDAVPSDPLPLTLRDPPTLSPGLAEAAPQARLFPGTEDLVAHELPQPLDPGGWAEDLSALHALPVPQRPAHEPVVAPPAKQADTVAPGRPKPTPVAARPPAGTAAPVKVSKAPKPPKVPKVSLLSGLPRALLVDDSAIALLFLEKRLEPWQIESDTASNSQAALALLAQHSYDLVFLDVELGDDSALDGLALCRQIKQTPASMNAMVLMVSAHHSELDRVRGALAGCDAYLAKPLDEEELLRLLQRQGLRLKAEAGSVPG